MILVRAGSRKWVFLGVEIAVLAVLANLACAGLADENRDEEAEPWWSVSIITEYASKYIFRGVNSLPGSSIARVDAAFTAYDFSLGILQITGIGKSFEELEFTLEFSREFGALTLSGGYINYYFPSDDGLRLTYKDTQEVFAEASYTFGSSVTASLACYSDFDKINGSYLDLKLSDNIPILKKRLSVQPYVSISYDFRYNSKTRAFNNFETGASFPVAIGKRFTLAGFGALSIPLHALKGVAEQEAWGGVTVNFSF
jgi:hypothetical protein